MHKKHIICNGGKCTPLRYLRRLFDSVSLSDMRYFMLKIMSDTTAFSVYDCKDALLFESGTN